MLGSIALVVALLYIGRWSVAFLSERWWAATISGPAAGLVVRWRLLGVALDIAAITVASCWFSLQALLVARTVATVSVSRQLGNLQLREAVPTRFLWMAGVGTGVLLGLITGAGARNWRAPVALAAQGLRYGVVDPLLGEDVGLYVAQLPVWDLAFNFAITLVLLGIVVTVMLYVGIGGIKREVRGLQIHPDARRHLGWLLAVLALVIASGYLIEPYHLAAGTDTSIGALAFVTRVRAAQIMAGVAVGVSLLSIAWLRRGRHSLLVGSWGALLLGALLEQLVIPSLAAESAPPAVGVAEIRRFESIAWGIHEAPGAPVTDTIPAPTAIWDESILSHWFAAGGDRYLGAAPGTLPTPSGPVAGWLVATTPAEDGHRVNLVGVVEGIVTNDGQPFRVRAGGAADTVSPILSVADPRLRPGAEGWRPTLTGVAPGGLLRRFSLAWARQSWGIVPASSARAVDWHLDPTERAAAVLPMASWSAATPAAIDGRLVWVVQGTLSLRSAPLSPRELWRGQEVSGLVPGFVAAMDAVSGAMTIYLDPGADSLAVSWSRYAEGTVRPAAEMPPGLSEALPYPPAWFAAQLMVLEGPAWALGRRPGRSAADGPPEFPLVGWQSPREASRVAVFEDPARRVVSAIVSAARTNGVPRLRVERIDRSAIPNGRELERDWDRDPQLAHLRDSVHAAGDTLHVPAVRWRTGAGDLVAWQPVFAEPAKGRPALLGVGGAVGERVASARTPSDLWTALLLRPGSDSSAGSQDAGRLDAALEWLHRADSALARHDLTAFGRAYEELRKVLERPPR